MTPVVVIIIAIIAAYFLLPVIGRLLKRLAINFMHRRAEDYFSRAMGIDPKEARKARKAKARRSAASGASGGFGFAGRSSRAAGPEPVIPPEYAEDVEYAEFKDFSEEEIAPGPRRESFVSEEQVSDAEWEDIPDKK